jgi:hypothetical protein
MIAHAYSHALDYKARFTLSKHDVDISDYSDNIYRKLDFSINYINDLKNDESYINIGNTFHYSPITLPDNKNIIFNGYFQSEKFFLSNSLKVKRLFSPTDEFIKKYHNKFPFLTNDDTVVINVRRGDYLHYPKQHPVISKEYIFKSLKYITNDKSLPVIVISDDIEWCKENLKIDNAHFIDDILPWEALWLISLCKHFIISNSSFSWWGAYLGEKENSIVLCPDIWFGPKISLPIFDIYKDSWVKVPTYYEEGVLYPK